MFNLKTVRAFLPEKKDKNGDHEACKIQAV